MSDLTAMDPVGSWIYDLQDFQDFIQKIVHIVKKCPHAFSHFAVSKHMNIIAGPHNAEFNHCSETR